jgi:dethiobiotin synthase
MLRIPKRLFVAGTDTGVGKTLVSAMLMAGLDGYYWKPIQSGAGEGADTGWIREKTGMASDRFFPEAYCLEAPMSPHAAAALENVTIDLSKIQMPVPAGEAPLVIEGAGGLMVPINDRSLMIDVIKRLGTPVLLVARSTLGTINHTLLSLEKMKSADVDVVGVAMNGPLDVSNRNAIEHFGNVRVVAEIEMMREINAVTLRDAYFKCFRMGGAYNRSEWKE